MISENIPHNLCQEQTIWTSYFYVLQASQNVSCHSLKHHTRIINEDVSH